MYKLIHMLFGLAMSFAVLISPLIYSAPVLAETTEETAIGDVTDPGMLPDSAFYFMKSWGRNLQLMFAGSNTEKARLMLKFTNEDALALKKIYEIGKYDVGSKHTEQYALQLQKTVQYMDLIRTRQGANVSEDMISKLQQNYLRQQEVLLSVLEKAPEAAQNGLLNALENSNKRVAAMVMAQKGEQALQQYQELVNQQTNNMGQEAKIRVMQRLEVMHGQALQQGVTTQTQNRTQSDNQTSQQTMQQNGQQNMQNQGVGSNTQSGNSNQSAGQKKLSAK